MAVLLQRFADVTRLPGIEQVRTYQRSWLRWDVLAGITVAAYLVPQCMAYGVLAGLNPVVGLWRLCRPLRCTPCSGPRANCPSDRSPPAPS